MGVIELVANKLTFHCVLHYLVFKHSLCLHSFKFFIKVLSDVILHSKAEVDWLKKEI